MPSYEVIVLLLANTFFTCILQDSDHAFDILSLFCACTMKTSYEAIEEWRMINGCISCIKSDRRALPISVWHDADGAGTRKTRRK